MGVKEGEILLILGEEKVFKDPVHQYIYVQDRLIWDLIDTKAFQRLRRIKQLGTTFFTFHGAEHSRFSHSLGVYEISRKIISLFKRNGYVDWTEEETLLTLTSALLHDIGHGSFSHSFEKIFQFSHEDWSKQIILEDKEINKLLINIGSNFPEKVVNVLNKTYSNQIIVNMISSQLDADRMDYLLRDAYFTGVNYGKYDLERILRVLRPYNESWVVKDSGMHSVEDYLMSRYQMYWQIYFHPVTRSGEIILRKIFLRAKDLYDNNYTFSTLFEPVKALFEQKLNVEDYLVIDDPFIYTLFYFWTKEKDPVLTDLAERFINRRLFQYIEFDPNDSRKMEKIKNLFLDNKIDLKYYLETDSPSDLSYDFYRLGKESNEESPIFLLDDEGGLTEISKKSDIIASITGRRKTIHKLYFPLDLLKDKGVDTKFKQIIELGP